MMKKYASLLFALVLALSLSVSAAADADVYVYDDADILSTDECAALNEAAAAVSEQYGCGVYVVTVDDMADYIDPDTVTETGETGMAAFTEYAWDALGLAASYDTTGPFKDLSDRPVFDPGYPIIDANILFDDASGKTYLYYSRCCYKHAVESEVSAWAKTKGWFDEIEESWIYGVELKPDFSGVIGEPVALLCPPKTMDDPQAKWENRSVTTHEVNRRWTEGSYMVKHGNLYYMLYSANFFGGKNYAVGYATSQSPLGPFIKAANNPVLQKNTEQGGIVTGTGHCMLIDIHNRLYCVYHGRTETTGDERMVFIDLIDIQPDGKLVVHGPNTDLQKITY